MSRRVAQLKLFLQVAKLMFSFQKLINQDCWTPTMMMVVVLTSLVGEGVVGACGGGYVLGYSLNR